MQGQRVNNFYLNQIDARINLCKGDIENVLLSKYNVMSLKDLNPYYINEILETIQDFIEKERTWKTNQI
jgi:hypothetical protein